MVTRSESPRGPDEMVYWRGWRVPSGRSTAIATYCPVRCRGVSPCTGLRTREKISSLSSKRSTTRYCRHGFSGSVPPSAYILASSAMSWQAKSQYTSSHAAATSGVTASPRTVPTALSRW